MIGQVIGDYRVVKQLGEGGMGMVYLGEHNVLRQKVAIKALHPTLFGNDSARDRFVREAEVLARLNHPNIIRLLNFYNIPQGCFIVMEYAEGETLEDRLQKQGLIPPHVCVPIFIQVLRALGYAHKQGVIHRDLKPSNIMMTPDGMAKLLDFGTAKLTDESARKLTQQGMTLGTIIYMSKEQLLGKPLDARSDVYSLGVTLYETTTGQLPFYDEDEKKLVIKIAKADPTPPSQHYPPMPKDLEKIILKSLAKEPDQRFASAEEMAQALERFCASGAIVVPVAPSSPVGATIMTTSKQAPPSTDKAAAPSGGGGGGGTGLLVAGVALLLLGIAGGGVCIGVLHKLGLGVGVLAGGLVLGAVLVLLGLLGGKKKGGGASKRVCPTCGRAMLENMKECPFCKPAGSTSGAGLGGTVNQPPSLPTPAAGANAGAGSGAANVYIIDGADKGKLFPLTNGVLTVGRAPGNTVVLNDPGVSSNHCSIVHDGARFVIQDLGARNGTFVNNVKITRQHLNSGDYIVVGTTRFVVNLK